MQIGRMARDCNCGSLKSFHGNLGRRTYCRAAIGQPRRATIDRSPRVAFKGIEGRRGKSDAD